MEKEISRGMIMLKGSRVAHLLLPESEEVKVK
jgi:hypothetical protein